MDSNVVDSVKCDVVAAYRRRELELAVHTLVENVRSRYATNQHERVPTDVISSTIIPTSWQEQLTQQLHLTEQEWQQVERAAREQYQQQQSSTLPSLPAASGTSTSISLFGAGSGGLSSILTWDMILEQASSRSSGTNDAATMDLLLQVQFLDDLLADWPRVQQFLQRPAPELASTLAPSSQLCRLHRHLYSKSRSSPHEFVAARRDILRNVVHFIDQQRGVRGNNAILADAIGTWARLLVDIWYDWIMQHGVVFAQDDATLECGAVVWTWLANDVPMMDILLDNNVDCWCRWIQTLSLAHLSAYWMKDVNTFANLWKIAGIADQASSHGPTATHRARGDAALLILSSVLHVSRISHFPWHQLSGSPQESIQLLACAYLSRSSTQHEINDEALVTIMAGTQRLYPALYDSLIGTIEKKDAALMSRIQSIL